MENWQKLLGVIRSSNAVRHPEKLDPKRSFQQQELDSLDQASIFLAVEEAYGIKIFAAQERRPESFQELLSRIERHAKP